MIYAVLDKSLSENAIPFTLTNFTSFCTFTYESYVPHENDILAFVMQSKMHLFQFPRIVF